VGGHEVFERCLTQCAGETRVVDRACQHERTDHGGYGDKSVVVRAGLSPVRQLTGDEVDHLLDATRGSAAHFGCLAWHLRTERGGRAARFAAVYVLLGKIRL